jgi:hypothetical protein
VSPFGGFGLIPYDRRRVKALDRGRDPLSRRQELYAHGSAAWMSQLRKSSRTASHIFTRR